MATEVARAFGKRDAAPSSSTRRETGERVAVYKCQSPNETGRPRRVHSRRTSSSCQRIAQDVVDGVISVIIIIVISIIVIIIIIIMFSVFIPDSDVRARESFGVGSTFLRD